MAAYYVETGARRPLRHALSLLSGLYEAGSVARRARSVEKIAGPLEARLGAIFQRQGALFLRGFRRLRPLFREALTESSWIQVFDEASGITRALFFDAIQEAAQAALLAGARDTIGEIGLDIAFNLDHPQAVRYLAEHGYTLITNIDEVTRRRIGRVITEGTIEGWGYDRMAREITGMYSEMGLAKPQRHIRTRAHLIAVTETGQAYEHASLSVVNDLAVAGLTMEKSWLTVGDDRVSDGCIANAAAGWIPVAQAFPSGHARPLRFPGCRCTALYQRQQKPRAPAPRLPKPEAPASAARRQLAALEAEYTQRQADLQAQQQATIDKTEAITREIELLIDVGSRYEIDSALWNNVGAQVKELQAQRNVHYERLDLIWKEISGLRAERLARGRALLEVSDPIKIQFAKGTSKTLKDQCSAGLEGFRRLVSQSVTNESQAGFKRTQAGRSYYETYQGRIRMSSGAGSGTVVHELGHWLEDASPDVHKAALAFLDRRTEGEDLAWLGQGYGKSEKTRRDKFLSPYMGKEYHTAHHGRYGSEIVSMGLEYMYTQPEAFARDDPDMFDFIFNLARGNYLP